MLARYLGIEIGGTKLQLGVGSGQGGSLDVLERFEVDREQGAEGIRQQIHQAATRLLSQHQVAAIGVGFGGPVDTAAGRILRSFHIQGWDGFPIVDWCRTQFGLPVLLGNDSDLAGLGEARFGAGRGGRIVFYSNVGSGIGGALVIDGQLYRGSGGVASELGHLRPGPEARSPDQTVESVSSGWALAAAAQEALNNVDIGGNSPASDLADPIGLHAALEAAEARITGLSDHLDLLSRCQNDPTRLTAKIVAEAAAADNKLARKVFRQGVQTYGWAVAQMITLLAPDVVVIGGGVPRVDECLFLGPLREQVEQYVFPPLKGTYRLVPAGLGEEVVVHGALALAAGAPEG